MHAKTKSAVGEAEENGNYSNSSIATTRIIREEIPIRSGVKYAFNSHHGIKRKERDIFKDNCS